MTFLDFIIFMLDVIVGHTPLISPLLSSVKMFRLRLLHIRRLDFAFIWIRCSDFICITLASIVVRRSNFVFYISGIQTSPLYGSDVQISSISHFLAPQLDVQTSSSAYQAFRFRLHMDKMFRLHLHHIC